MYATQFPNDFPPMPDGFMEAIQADPGGFAGAMGGGMEAMQAHMEANPGDMEGGFEAMGAAMEGPMADMGISPEMFEAAGDTFGAIAGPAMMGMPADAGPADMGQCMNDCMEHAMPEGMDMPPEMGPMFDNMGETFDAADMGPHDMGAEMGPPMPDGCRIDVLVIQRLWVKIMVQLTWVHQQVTWVVAQVTCLALLVTCLALQAT